MKEKKKKILVTGSTGFLGKYVVLELLRRSGISVIATSRNRKKATNADWHKDVTYISYDLAKNDIQNLSYHFGIPDSLIHLAWDYLPNYNDIRHIERCLIENITFLKKLFEQGLKDLTVIGTCQEYGMQNGCMRENAHSEPRTAYAIAKDALRKYLEKAAEEYDFNFKWIRLFYVWGKGQRSTSLISQLEKALANKMTTFNMSMGEQLRDFIPVEDAASHIADIALQQVVRGIINCCSGSPKSVKTFVEEYLKANGQKINLNLGHFSYPKYEPMAFWGDREKLERLKKIKGG